MTRVGIVLESMSVVSMVALLAAAPAVAAEPCPHPFFPVTDGMVLRYRAGKQELIARYASAGRGGPKQTGTLSLQVGEQGRQGSTQTLCNDQGLTTETGGLGVLALQSAGLDVKITESEGVLLLPLHRMRAGEAWTSKVSVELTPPADVKMPGGLRPVMRSTFRSEAQLAGEEELTTAAGTFRTLKVKTRTTAVAGSTGSERSIDSFLWFAEGVGLVKVMTGDHVDLELVELVRPAPKVEPAKGGRMKKPALQGAKAQR